VFYPPQWLIFLPSYLAGFKLHIIFHYYLAAIGMYCLARSLRFGALAALLAAIAYALGGPLISLGELLPFLFAMSWLPWLMLFALRFHRHGRKTDFALAAVSLAMEIIIGEQRGGH
jgi:fatty acid desaturase